MKPLDDHSVLFVCVCVYNYRTHIEGDCPNIPSWTCTNGQVKTFVPGSRIKALTRKQACSWVSMLCSVSLSIVSKISNKRISMFVLVSTFIPTLMFKDNDIFLMLAFTKYIPFCRTVCLFGLYRSQMTPKCGKNHVSFFVFKMNSILLCLHLHSSGHQWKSSNFDGKSRLKRAWHQNTGEEIRNISTNHKVDRRKEGFS